MGVFGFGNVGGAVGEDALAGFPSDGLSFLYKCDERTGDKLYDASGQWQPLQMSTGSALDCTGASANLSFTDSTGLAAAFSGRDGIAIAGFELITPATAAKKFLLGGAVSVTSPVQVYLDVASTKFRVYVKTRTQVGEGAPALTTWFTPTDIPRIKLGTHCQIAVMVNTVTLAGVISIRNGVTGSWVRTALTGSGVAAGENVFPATPVDFGLLADNTDAATPATPFNGKMMLAFVGAIEAEVQAAERLLERPTASYALEVLGAHGRMWDFRAGTGTTVKELTTGTLETINVVAGSIGWTNSLPGCSQIALRQGRAYYGKAGVRIGGETSMVATGGGAIGTANAGASLGGDTGWTFQVTSAIGERDPATDAQIIAMAIAPQLAGTYLSDPDTVQGVGIYLSTAQAVVARAVRAVADTLYSGAAGAGNNDRQMGLLTTYTIVSPATTGSGTLGFSVYRQRIGESAPTKVGDYSDTVDLRQTACDQIWVGNAAFNADATVGFVAGYSRPITTAEMAQCHRSAAARMTGEPLFVAVGGGNYGNGSENRPYTLMLPARRKSQPGQVIHMAAGTYPVFNEYTAVTKSSTTAGITVLTGGAVIFEGAAGGTDAHYPLYLTDGSWTLTATAPGYFHFLADGASNLAAGKVFTGVDYFGLTNGKFSGGFASGANTGSGLNLQAESWSLVNVTAYDNDEHGIYARIQADDSDKAFHLSGIYCYGNTEDGVKFSSEGGGGASWVGTGDKIRVDGGQNQLWLAGVKDSVFTNLVLENQASAGTTGALYLGYAGGTGGEDTSVNNTIANVTIYNAVTAILDQQSTGTTIRNLVASECTKDFVQGELGTSVITYSVGLGDANPLPTDPTNIPESADLALVDPANVTPASRDFHLDEGVDGEGDGANLTTAVPQAATDYAGDARPTTGHWNMGAY